MQMLKHQSREGPKILHFYKLPGDAQTANIPWLGLLQVTSSHSLG